MRAIYKEFWELLKQNQHKTVGEAMPKILALMRSPILDVFKHRSSRPLDTERWLINSGFNAEAYNDGSVMIIGRSLSGNPHYRCVVRDQQWLICLIREDGQLWIERFFSLSEADRYLRDIGEPDYIMTKRSNKAYHKDEEYISAKKRYNQTHDFRGVPYEPDYSIGGNSND